MEMHATYSHKLSLIEFAIYSIVLKYYTNKEFILVSIFIGQSIENDGNWLTKLSMHK